MLVGLEARALKPPATDPTTARPRMTQIPIFKSLSKLMASKNLKIALKPWGTLLLSKISLALPAGLASLNWRRISSPDFSYLLFNWTGRLSGLGASSRNVLAGGGRLSKLVEQLCPV